MSTAAKLLAQAIELPEDEREDLAAALLHSIEPPRSVSIEDRVAIETRAADARSGVPGVAWDDVKRGLAK